MVEVFLGNNIMIFDDLFFIDKNSEVGLALEKDEAEIIFLIKCSYFVYLNW